MEDKLQNLAKLKSQEKTVRQHIDKLELEIKMAQATGKSDSIKEFESEMIGLTKLSQELNSQIAELSQIVEAEKQEVLTKQQLEVEQAEEAVRLSRDAHAEKSKELYASGQKYMVLGFFMIIGGLFLIIDFSWQIYAPLIAWGLYVLVEGGKMHRQSVNEKYYSQGLTEEDLSEIRSNVAEEYERKERDNEQLARAIAKEMKK